MRRFVRILFAGGAGLSLVACVSPSRYREQLRAADAHASDAKTQRLALRQCRARARDQDKALETLKRSLARGRQRAQVAAHHARKAATAARLEILHARKALAAVRAQVGTFVHGLRARDLTTQLTKVAPVLRQCARVGGQAIEASGDVKILVGPRGRVTRVTIEELEPGSHPVAVRRCLIRAYRALRFPKPQGGFPVVFRAQLSLAGAVVLSKALQRQKGCKTDDDCVLTLLRQDRCCFPNCYGKRAFNRSYIKVLAREIARKCGRPVKRCARFTCRPTHRGSVSFHPRARCLQGVCTRVTARSGGGRSPFNPF